MKMRRVAMKRFEEMKERYEIGEMLEGEVFLSGSRL